MRHALPINPTRRHGRDQPDGKQFPVRLEKPARVYRGAQKHSANAARSCWFPRVERYKRYAFPVVTNGYCTDNAGRRACYASRCNCTDVTRVHRRGDHGDASIFPSAAANVRLSDNGSVTSQIFGRFWVVLAPTSFFFLLEIYLVSPTLPPRWQNSKQDYYLYGPPFSIHPRMTNALDLQWTGETYG